MPIRNGAWALAIALLVTVAIYRTADRPQALWMPDNIDVIGRSGREIASRADRTLLVVLKDGCGYCASSVPFYRRILDERAVRAPKGSLRVVAVVLEQSNRAAALRYLEQYRLAFDDVLLLSDGQRGRLGVPGTPTLLLTDRSGSISRRWAGKLRLAGERDVLASLFPTPRAVSSAPGSSAER